MTCTQKAASEIAVFKRATECCFFKLLCKAFLFFSLNLIISNGKSSLKKIVLLQNDNASNWLYLVIRPIFSKPQISTPLKANISQIFNEIFIRTNR